MDARTASARSRRRAPPDAETRAAHDHHESLRLWLRLLATTRVVEARVRRLLHEQFATTLPRFDLMAQLERHPQGLRMSELSRRMMVTGGNVTGITDLLERERLVARTSDPADRRAWRVRLTPAGRRAFAAMAAAHEGWIVDSFAALAVRERGALGATLQRLKAQVRSLEEGRSE